MGKQVRADRPWSGEAPEASAYEAGAGGAVPQEMCSRVTAKRRWGWTPCSPRYAARAARAARVMSPWYHAAGS